MCAFFSLASETVFTLRGNYIVRVRMLLGSLGTKENGRRECQWSVRDVNVRNVYSHKENIQRINMPTF